MADDLIGLNLDVYDTRNGLWHPEHGELELPGGWEFLPSGDAFVTRQVKNGGVYWVLWRPRGRREHRRKLGLLAPTETIGAARAAAVATEARRAVQRASNATSRDRAEATYRTQFAETVFRWLDFAPEHDALADAIARGAVEQAAVVGSGRVGRARTIPIEERAALAARAYIRHHHTGYEDALARLDPFETQVDITTYREIKASAHQSVDEFLEAHRRT
ncbi:MAG: DUF2293 domain-containing protein [Acidimicrobiia bacterium]